MKVEVTKSSSDAYWYADFIGGVFEVEDPPADKDNYLLKDGIRCILKKDAKAVSWGIDDAFDANPCTNCEGQCYNQDSIHAESLQAEHETTLENVHKASKWVLSQADVSYIPQRVSEAVNLLIDKNLTAEDVKLILCIYKHLEK